MAQSVLATASRLGAQALKQVRRARWSGPPQGLPAPGLHALPSLGSSGAPWLRRSPGGGPTWRFGGAARAALAPAPRPPTPSPRPFAQAGQSSVRLVDHFPRELVDDIFAFALKKQTGVSLKYM